MRRGPPVEASLYHYQEGWHHGRPTAVVIVDVGNLASSVKSLKCGWLAQAHTCHVEVS